MVVVVEAKGLVHVLDSVQWHDVEAMVDADAVHARAYFEQLARSVVAMVLIDLLDTEILK